MNRYRITYMELETVDGKMRGRTVLVGEQSAKNGLTAIRELLAERGVSAEDIATGRSMGSNKRFTLAGVTFMANKVSA